MGVGSFGSLRFTLRMTVKKTMDLAEFREKGPIIFKILVDRE